MTRVSLDHALYLKLQSRSEDPTQTLGFIAHFLKLAVHLTFDIKLWL